MTFSSDQTSQASNFSPNARRLLALRETVFATWEKRVRERIGQARALQHPILIDTLPVFYDNIIESMSPAHPRALAVDGNTMASEHGGERARLTAYDQSAVIEEYQILRWALFEVIHQEHLVLDHHETHAIHGSIDAGIRQSVEAFSLVQTGFRERFAAALMHDLRNPLSANITALELILLVNDPTTIKEAAAKALSSAQRISSMINELLDTMAFHVGESVQLAISRFDIRQVVKEVHADAVGTHGPRIRVSGPSVDGWWDRAALKRVLENLVTNAVKYGSAAGPITMETREFHGRLILSVHNEGPPIPVEEQECVFQMYRRTEGAQRGSKQGWGIGLPYVRAVAESHGGSIGLDSSLERGTTFVIDIPVDGRPYRKQPGPSLET